MSSIPTEIKTVKDLKDWLSQFPDETVCMGSDSRCDGSFPLLRQRMCFSCVVEWEPNRFEKAFGVKEGDTIVVFECDCF